MFHYYVKLAWLSLKKTPVLSSLIICIIAIGIGVACTTTAYQRVLSVNPMQHKNDNLFAIQLDSRGKGGGGYMSDGLNPQITYQDAINLRKSEVAIRKTASIRTTHIVESIDKQVKAFLVNGRAVDTDFFAMFDAPFAYGSAWDKSIDEQAMNITVISDAMNQKLFAGGNNIGAKVLLDNKEYTVVGILQPWQLMPNIYDVNNQHFAGPEDFFMPFSLLPIHEIHNSGNTNGWKNEVLVTYEDRLNSELFWIQYWVEFKDKTEKENYETFLKNYIQEQKKFGRFEREHAAGIMRNPQQWLEYNNVVPDDVEVMRAVSFMFLAVCMINTIGLILAKFIKRAAETGVRRALGASQKNIFMQNIVEVGLMGLCGGLLGFLLTLLGLAGIRTLTKQHASIVQMDTTMLLFTLCIAITCTIMAGLFPAAKVCRTQPSIYLKMQ